MKQVAQNTQPEGLGLGLNLSSMICIPCSLSQASVSVQPGMSAD